MLISLEETLISLTEAARRLPGRPHASTLWRWHARGIKGVHLETLAIAGRRYTSTQALDRFVAATTYAATGQPTPLRTLRQRERDQVLAEKELRQAGI
jgi:hypothetical protein